MMTSSAGREHPDYRPPGDGQPEAEGRDRKRTARQVLATFQGRLEQIEAALPRPASSRQASPNIAVRTRSRTTATSRRNRIKQNAGQRRRFGIVGESSVHGLEQ